MTKVNSCALLRCVNNTDGKCTVDEIDLIESYGRSTQYVHEFMCEQYERSKTD